jgi:DNA-binding transcriptional MerR regulator
VSVLVPIGEFSKMTYVSVKALRHYHEVGLLEPAAIDPASGYRLYAPAQVPVAQAIRRFRDLDMPLETIRAVLQAPDHRTRNDAIVAHLERMQQELARTQHTIASLQALLAAPRPPGEVAVRDIAPLAVLARTDVVAFDACGAWLGEVLAELHGSAAETGITVAGDDGALYEDAFFQDGVGTVTAFVPVRAPQDADATARIEIVDLPGARYAVMAHEGPFDELDRTYGALGTYVLQRGMGASGAIREHYLDDDRAEVCWPVADHPG